MNLACVRQKPAMKVRVFCKYFKSEKNTTVISSERHSDDSGQER